MDEVASTDEMVEAWQEHSHWEAVAAKLTEEDVKSRTAMGTGGVCPPNPEACEGLANPFRDVRVECPKSETVHCPHYDMRCVYDEKTCLRDLGFPVDAQQPNWDQVPGAYDNLREYCETIDERVEKGEGVILSGGVGSGKTCALALIALAARDYLRKVQYIYAADLYDALHNRESLGDKCQECDLLLLDDWGTEYPSQWSANRFQSLIHHRHAERLTTCVTSNLSIESIREDRELARIFDRLRERNVAMQTKAGSQRQSMTVEQWENDSEAELMHRQEVDG